MKMISPIALHSKDHRNHSQKAFSGYRPIFDVVTAQHQDGGLTKN